MKDKFYNIKIEFKQEGMDKEGNIDISCVVTDYEPIEDSYRGNFNVTTELGILESSGCFGFYGRTIFILGKNISKDDILRRTSVNEFIVANTLRVLANIKVQERFKEYEDISF